MPKLAEASAGKDGWLSDMPEPKKESARLPALPSFEARVPVYPVLSVPVNDPLWRRPALLASALAGLLVGLAAYGVRWTREQAASYEPAVATAATTPQESGMTVHELEPEADALVERRAEPPLASIASTASIDEAPSSAKAAKAAPRKQPPRAAQSKPARARAASVNRSSKAAAAPEIADIAEPRPAANAVEAPSTSRASFAEAMAVVAESGQASVADPQAKSQPSSSESDGFGGYTPFSRDAALSALSVAANQATHCRSNEGPFGAARIAVTFAPSGNVTTAVVEGPPFAGTSVGSCLARTFREARVSPFSGKPVTVRKSVSLF